jgi:hypothetical protein
MVFSGPVVIIAFLSIAYLIIAREDDDDQELHLYVSLLSTLCNLAVVQIYCTCKCTNRLQYNDFASARSNPQGIVFLKANLNLN